MHSTENGAPFSSSDSDVRQMKIMKHAFTVVLMAIVGCTTPAATSLSPTDTVADAISVFQRCTSIERTTQAEFVTQFGKGQDWMRGNMTNATGVSQFCWTFIFRQTNGTVFVNFSTDDTSEPTEEWRIFSITPKIDEQDSHPAVDNEITINF